MATNDPAPVILIDDDADLLKATRQTLELAGFAVSAFSMAREALAGLDAGFAGVVVSDIRMPEIDGLQLFDHIVEVDPDIPVILVTGHGDIAMAVKAIKDGAYDFITKPFAADRLAQSVWRAAEKRRLVMENRALREAAEQAQDSLPLIGQTPAMERLRRTLRQIADTDVDVLVTGETGSGKEVVASLLHRWSRRAQGNFVALNCGTLPETVIESELFGHEAGAFTGAQKKRIGRIEHSSGGTLFLDEIGDMPMEAQTRLLRVLQQGEYTTVGGRTPIKTDVRIVAATNKDLRTLINQGLFREDLFYRLNVVPLRLPALRERSEDIPDLVRHFFKQGASEGLQTKRISSGGIELMKRYPWPGNVRELENLIRRLAALYSQDEISSEIIEAELKTGE
ncbi:MAG: sigma-54-dependent Fis family transcriptional regulator, partial [Mesorhizobium sp.]